MAHLSALYLRQHTCIQKGLKFFLTCFLPHRVAPCRPTRLHFLQRNEKVAHRIREVDHVSDLTLTKRPDIVVDLPYKIPKYLSLFNLSNNVVVVVVKFGIFLDLATVFGQMIKIVFILAIILNERVVHLIINFELNLCSSKL